MNAVWCILSRTSESCGVVSKYVLCYVILKRQLGERKLNHFFFQKTLPFNGRKGQVISHTSHLLYAMWAVMYFHHRHIPHVLWYNLTYLGYLKFVS